MRGPNPSEKRSTLTSNSFANTKCPSSCTRISTPSSTSDGRRPTPSGAHAASLMRAARAAARRRHRRPRSRRGLGEPFAGQRRLDRLQQRRRCVAPSRAEIGDHRQVAARRAGSARALLVGQQIDLVHHQDPARLGQPQVRQDRLDRRDLLLVRRIGGVDDVQQQVGLVQLLERGAERARRDRCGRSRMKPTVSAMMTSRSRGKRSRRVVGSSVANSLSSASTSLRGERVEQRRLAGVGVADDRDDRQPAPHALGAPPRPLLAEAVDLLLEAVDALARAAAVLLQLGLAGAAPADAAGQPAHHRVLLVQARQPVARAAPARPAACRRGSSRAARRCRGSASCGR